MENLFVKINNEEYWELVEKKHIPIPIVGEEYAIIYDKMRKEIRKSKILIPLSCDMKRTNSRDDNVKNSLNMYLRNNKHHCNIITISKVPDDYFILRFSNTLVNNPNFKCDQIDGLLDCIEHVFDTLIYFNESKNVDMNHLKLFEAYSGDDYQKALFKVKDMIRGKKSSDDILAFVNKYASDDAKQIDQLRIMLDRISKTYNNFSRYFFYNRRERIIKKRGKEDEIKNEYDYKMYFAFDEPQKKILDSFLQQEKNRYNFISDKIDESIDLTMVKFVFEKLFELLDWVSETGIAKGKLSSNHDITDEQVISRVEDLNELDFENECDELKKLVRIGKVQIRKVINSIN